jgi:hypothetical protein
MDFTLVTACFDTSEFNTRPISIATGIGKIDVVLQLPVNLVIYTDDKYFDEISRRRSLYGFDSTTRIIKQQLNELWTFKYLDKVKENRNKYFPTRDERTSPESHCIVCNKFDFVLQTIENNPFDSTKFGWLDAFLGVNGKMRFCEDYTQEKFMSLLERITDKFHINILNVNDKKYKLAENKREYYQTYPYVVCGGLFTCGKNIGIKILTRLKEIFVTTTNLGYGHGEEPLYLEVLDEYYDDIIKSYSDYAQICNNLIVVERNLDYIYHFIIKRYLHFCYYRECFDCCTKLLDGIENYNTNVSGQTYMNILYSYYLSSFCLKKETTECIVSHIYNVCRNNPAVKQAFDNNREFYELQFAHTCIPSNYSLVINVFACATIKKYKDEILKINETWGKRAKEKGIKVLFFLGEEKTELEGENYVYLKGVNNDYISASHKQNLGLKYTHDNFNPDFVLVCGTDTYINIDKLLAYLSKFDKTKDLYIGGHGDYRMIGYNNIYFHSGGPGFIITKKTLEQIYPLLDGLHQEWEKICTVYKLDNLKAACDVLIAYYLKNSQIIKDQSFIHCNHKGYCCNNIYKCCSGKFDIKNIISCHSMTLTDFDEYTKLLQDNNYFL